MGWRKMLLSSLVSSAVASVVFLPSLIERSFIVLIATFFPVVWSSYTLLHALLSTQAITIL